MIYDLLPWVIFISGLLIGIVILLLLPENYLEDL